VGKIKSFSLCVLDCYSSTLSLGSGELRRSNNRRLGLSSMGLRCALGDRRALVLTSTRGWSVISRYLGRVPRHGLATRSIVGSGIIHLLIVRSGGLALRVHHGIRRVAVHRHLWPHVRIELPGVWVLWHLLVRAARRRLVVIWRHRTGRHVVCLGHRRRQGRASVRWGRGGAELLLAVVSEIARHTTSSLVRRTPLEAGVGRVAHVLVAVIVVVITAAAAAGRGEVSTSHTALGWDRLVVHICVAVARVSPHMRRGIRIVRHRRSSHVGAIAIAATETAKCHRAALLGARRRSATASGVLWDWRR
jgi:hypothetical protein